MKNKYIYLSALLLFIPFLYGCNNGESAETPIEEKAAENENVKEEVVEEIESPPPSLEKVKTEVDQLVSEFYTIFNEAGIEYDLLNKPLTDEVYEQMAQKLEPYATDQLIQLNLRQVAEVYCYGGCDAIYFPRSTASGLRFQLNEATSQKVILQYVVPENELSGQSVEEVTLVNVDGSWKMDNYMQTSADLKLMKNEGEEILRNSGYSEVSFVKETDVDSRKAYIFKTSEGENLGVFSDTGYIFVYEDRAASKKEEYLRKMEVLEKELAYIDDLYDTESVADMQSHEEHRFHKWDDMLNEIYGVLKEQLTKSEMDALRQEQRKWVANRDPDAEKAADQLGGGWRYLQYMINRTVATKDRCYELVENYMK